MRTITVNDREWKYKVGRTTCVIRGDDGKSHQVELTKLTGLTWAEIERGQHKRYFHVTPSQVADWINAP